MRTIAVQLARAYRKCPRCGSKWVNGCTNNNCPNGR